MLVGLAVIAPVAACSTSGDSLSRSIGLTRDVPDEFVVTTRAPLSMPPNFSLRPPSPGAQRPQEMTQSLAAETALVPETALAGTPVQGTLSRGQTALLDAAGPPAPADIRTTVNRDAASEADNHGLTDKLMFWKSTPLPGIVVDPSAEAKRLRENAALGQPEDTGDTPIIQKPKSGLIPNIF